MTDLAPDYDFDDDVPSGMRIVSMVDDALAVANAGNGHHSDQSDQLTGRDPVRALLADGDVAGSLAAMAERIMGGDISNGAPERAVETITLLPATAPIADRIAEAYEHGQSTRMLTLIAEQAAGGYAGPPSTELQQRMDEALETGQVRDGIMMLANHYYPDQAFAPVPEVVDQRTPEELMQVALETGRVGAGLSLFARQLDAPRPQRAAPAPSSSETGPETVARLERELLEAKLRLVNGDA